MLAIPPETVRAAGRRGHRPRITICRSLLPVCWISMGNGVLPGQNVGTILAPFHSHHSAHVQIIVKTRRRPGPPRCAPDTGQSVQKGPGAAVVVDNGKGGAGNRIGAAQPFGDALAQGGFAGTQPAGEGDQSALGPAGQPVFGPGPPFPSREWVLYSSIWRILLLCGGRGGRLYRRPPQHKSCIVPIIPHWFAFVKFPMQPVAKTGPRGYNI